MKQATNAPGSPAARFAVQAFGLVRNAMLRGIALLLFACPLLLFTGFRKESSPNSIQKGNTIRKTVPFKGKGTVDISSGVPTGTAEATHLGRITGTVQDDDSGFPVITGTFTMIAANGDEIFGTHIGYAQELGNGMLHLDFENTITGGTGRFAGATGFFETHVLVNEITGKGSDTFEGTISY